MTQGQVKTIGQKQKPRKASVIADVEKVQGLKKILDQDFKSWSNFNNWAKNRPAAQFVFSKAMQAYKGKRVDVRCGCCDYIGSLPKLPEDLDMRGGNLSCYGIKTQWIIEKVVDEIKVAPSYKGMKPEDFS